MVFSHPIKPGAYPAGIKADSTVVWYKKDGRNRKVFLSGVPLHYFHVADCGMDRGGIISSRYSRWRSTAEEDLCTARLGLTKGRAPPGETQQRREDEGHSRVKPAANKHHSPLTCMKTSNGSGPAVTRVLQKVRTSKGLKSAKPTALRLRIRNEELSRLGLPAMKSC